MIIAEASSDAIDRSRRDLGRHVRIPGLHRPTVDWSAPSPTGWPDRRRSPASPGRRDDEAAPRRRCRGGGPKVELTATLETRDRGQRGGDGPGGGVGAAATARPGRRVGHEPGAPASRHAPDQAHDPAASGCIRRVSASARPAALELVPGGNVAAALSYRRRDRGRGRDRHRGVRRRGAALRASVPLERRHHALGPPGLRRLRPTGPASSARSRWPTSVGIAGTVDQDRLAGLHTDIGALPTTTRVRSTLSVRRDRAPPGPRRHGPCCRSSVDGGGAPRPQQPRPGARPDRTGVVTLRWGASGRRRDGSTWSFRRPRSWPTGSTRRSTRRSRSSSTSTPCSTTPSSRSRSTTCPSTGTVDPAYAEARLVRVEKLGPNGRWQAVNRRTPLTLVAAAKCSSAASCARCAPPVSRGSRCRSSPRPGRAAPGRSSSPAGASFDEEPGSGAATSTSSSPPIDRAPTGDTLRAELTVPVRRRLAARRSRGALGRRRRRRSSAASRSGWWSFPRWRSAQVSSGRSASAASVRWSAHAV